jgi:hypothetical protein
MPFMDSPAPPKQKPLTGPIKLRAHARVRYAEIVAELGLCGDGDEAHCYLLAVTPELAQFENEMPHHWHGDPEWGFAGLKAEIETAYHRIAGMCLEWQTVRLSDGK